MRFCRLLLLFAPLCFAFVAFSQPNDSALRHRDSLRHVVHDIAKKAVEGYRDSVKAERIKEDVRKNGKPLDAFLAEMKEEKKAGQRQLYFRVALVVLFLVVIAVGLFRRRKN